MRKFKVRFPAPSLGYKITEKKQVVPDQSMSLAEILRRFTRGEAVPVGMSPIAGEEEREIAEGLDIDLEKLSGADLTEKDEVKAELMDIQNRYKKAEEMKKKAEAEKAEADRKAAEETRIEREVARRVESRKRPDGGPDAN